MMMMMEGSGGGAMIPPAAEGNGFWVARARREDRARLKHGDRDPVTTQSLD